MKNQALALVLFLQSFSIFAQKELPSFGTIDKADLLLKQCDFDKDAEAYKLIDYGDVRYVSGKDVFSIRTERRVRIKILKDKGINYANIKIKYYSKEKYENITDISGVTYNLDDLGNVVTTKLEKSSIYIKPIDKEYSEVSFTMPDVKVGSVIEYKFSETKDSYSNLDDWYFQDQIPTRISMYKILIPSLFRFVNQVFAYQKIEQSQDEVREHAYSSIYGMLSYNSTEKTYILRNVRAVRDEPYMSAAKDYMQRIIFQLSKIDYGNGNVDEVRSSWPKLSKDLLYNEDFGFQLNKYIPHTKELDDSLATAKSEFKKMVTIYDFVQRNMNWNGAERIYTDDGIRSAWDKKSGSNTEINLILINLLRNAGLKAYPLLVSTKDNGSVDTLYPFIKQFNNSMACVFIEGKRYILNAADKYNPAYLMPYDVLNDEAYIVDEKNGGWILLNDEKGIYKNIVSIFAEIKPSGMMEGQATVTSSGYSKNPRVKTWKEDRTDFKNYFSYSLSGIKVDSIKVKNEDIDSLPLIQDVKFSLPVNSTGDYEYFPINLFQGLEKNPFVADERFTDIDFGYKQSYKLFSKIYIPEGFEFETLPKNIKMIMPDTSIVMTRMMQADSNSVDLIISVDFTKPSYAARIYPVIEEFYKKLYGTLNEQVVIKKKKNNS